jgi:hypothetical protein
MLAIPKLLSNRGEGGGVCEKRGLPPREIKRKKKYRTKTFKGKRSDKLERKNIPKNTLDGKTEKLWTIEEDLVLVGRIYNFFVEAGLGGGGKGRSTKS